MKKVISITITLIIVFFLFYGGYCITISQKMPISSGLGAFAKQGEGVVYIVIGLLILLIKYILKRKDVI